MPHYDRVCKLLFAGLILRSGEPNLQMVAGRWGIATWHDTIPPDTGKRKNYHNWIVICPREDPCKRHTHRYRNSSTENRGTSGGNGISALAIHRQVFIIHRCTVITRIVLMSGKIVFIVTSLIVRVGLAHFESSIGKITLLSVYEYTRKPWLLFIYLCP